MTLFYFTTDCSNIRFIHLFYIIQQQLKTIQKQQEVYCLVLKKRVGMVQKHKSYKVFNLVNVRISIHKYIFQP